MANDTKRLVRLIREYDHACGHPGPALDGKLYYGHKIDPAANVRNAIWRSIERHGPDELFAPPYEGSPLCAAIQSGNTNAAMQMLSKNGIASRYLLDENGSCQALADAERYGNEAVAEKIRAITEQGLSTHAASEHMQADMPSVQVPAKGMESLR